jgi:hypothetical protein
LHRGSVGSTQSTAQLLSEAMVLQVKQYEEWLDIMRDFSTVFSSENNSKPLRKAIDGIIEKSQSNANVR